MYYRRYRVRQGMTTGQKVAVGGVIAVAALSGVSGAHAAAKGTPARARAASGKAAEAIAYARAQLGAPYTWGGTGPYTTGFDCSGLVMMAWRAAGVSILRTSEDQSASLPQVSADQLQPGDLVFSYWPLVDNQPSPNHVQMYAGGGYVIGADSTTVERVPLSTDAGHIVGYARPAGVS